MCVGVGIKVFQTSKPQFQWNVIHHNKNEVVERLPAVEAMGMSEPRFSAVSAALNRKGLVLIFATKEKEIQSNCHKYKCALRVILGCWSVSLLSIIASHLRTFLAERQNHLMYDKVMLVWFFFSVMLFLDYINYNCTALWTKGCLNKINNKHLVSLKSECFEWKKPKSSPVSSNENIPTFGFLRVNWRMFVLFFFFAWADF